jgi:predicted RNase H-like HicB family nuclease/metal-responsive CopG/Arc/MetJ family transcriptional regulator
MRQYIALIHKDPDSDYGVSFPDLPGCVTAGLDLDDARSMAEEALALHLAGMAEDEQPIPESSSLEAVMSERENRDAVAILVKAPPAMTKAVRINMTMPANELDEIDRFAAENGYTRSGFLLHAAKKAIDEVAARRTDTDLTERVMWVEAKMNAVRANADTASAKADVVDPMWRLAQLVEMAPMEELQAVEAETDALRKVAQAAGDALQKAIEARRRLMKRG